MTDWALTGPWRALFDSFRFSRDGIVPAHQVGYESLLTEWLLARQRAGVRPGMSEMAEASLKLWEAAERAAKGIHEDRLSADALRAAWASGELLWLEHRQAGGLFVEARWLVMTDQLSIAEIEWLVAHAGGRYRDQDQSIQQVAYRSPLAQGEAPHTDADAAVRRILRAHLEQRLARAAVPGALTRWQAFRQYPAWQRWYDLFLTSKRVQDPRHPGDELA